MDFNYTEEQQMLADTVERFVADVYSLENRRQLAGTALGYSNDNWRQFADMGLLGLAVPEQYGGLASSPVETYIVMQALGRGLVLEPYWSTAVLAARLIATSGTADQQARWLPTIADGTKRFALATFERDARFDLNSIRSRAARTASGYLLAARKAVVLHADSADVLIVAARTSGADRERQGIQPVLVASATARVANSANVLASKRTLVRASRSRSMTSRDQSESLIPAPKGPSVFPR